MFQASRQLFLVQRTLAHTRALLAWRTLSNQGDKIIHPDAREEVPIPLPKERPGEPVQEKKARLLYQSRKRGMLENGLLLSTFAKKYLSAMTVPELEMYDSLINKPSNDWDIYYWAIGQREPPQEFDTKVLKMLQEHAQNKDLEMRNCQPDL